MKVSQKALALLLSAAMAISSFAGTGAFASAWAGNVGDVFDDGNYEFTVTNNLSPDSAVELTRIKPTADNSYSIPDTARSGDPSYTYPVTSVDEDAFPAQEAIRITYKGYTVQNFGGPAVGVHDSGSVGLYTDAHGVYAKAYPNEEDGYVFAHWVDVNGNVLTPPDPHQPNPYKFTNRVKTVCAVFEKGTPQPAKKTISAFLNAPEDGWSLSVKVGTNSIPFPDITVRYSDGTTGTIPNVKWFCTTGSDWNKVGHYVFQPDLIGYNLAGGLLPPKCSVAVETNTVNLVTGVSLPAAVNYVGDFTAHPAHQMKADVRPSNAANQKVTWESSDPSVATIDANGLMTLKSYGTTTITVITDDGFFTAFCKVTVQTQDDFNKKVDDAKDAVTSLPNASSATMDSATSQKIVDAVDAVQDLGEDAINHISSDQINNLETLLEKLTKAAGHVTEEVPQPTSAASIKSSDKVVDPPQVSNLLLAAGINGTETSSTLVDLQMNQVAPTDSNALLAFEMNLSKGPDEIHDLKIPVTVTFKLPDSFVYDSSRTYSIEHIKDDGDTESLPLTISGRYASFTTSSFSTFMLISTTNGGSSSGDSGSHSSGSSVGTTPSVVPSAATFASDTTADFTVNSNYQFKITGTNGAVPVLTVGTPGVFETQLVKTSGNDYYFKLIAIGAPGAKAGIYVNGVKLLVATVGTVSSVRCDTTKPFSLKAGASYVIKLTASLKPTLTSGNNSVFRVTAAGSAGYDGSNMRDYYFKVTAVGKAGGCTGFYVNGEKTPRTIAKIVK